MRILHINCNYIGTTLHQKMIEALDYLGIQNQVFVAVYVGRESVIKVNDNVMISECFKRWNRLFFYYKQKRIRKSLIEKIEVKKYDLIHAYTLFTDGNNAMQLSKKYEIPYVVAVRNTDVNTFFKKMPWLRRRGIQIMRNASRVFFLSESYKEEVFRKYVPDKYKKELINKVSVIPNGIDQFWIQNIVQDINEKKLKRIKNRQLRLIYVGQVDRNKNIIATQQAMELLRKAGWNVTLTVVGKIADKHEFKKMIQNSYTTYVEEQPKENLIKLYREHDIFVMPSITETFGLVYAEAMSQGLPVVYTKGQGFDGQFPEGIVGYHVDAKNHREIFEIIIKIIDRYEAIFKNVGHMAVKFEWAFLAKKYKNIYRIILNSENSIK